MNDKKRIQHEKMGMYQARQEMPSVTANPKQEDEELQQLAGSLAAFDARAYSKIETQLKQHLLTRMEHQQAYAKPANRPQHLRRFSLAALAAAVLLVVVFLSVPPLRAAADNLFIQIGKMFINNNPTDAEEYVAVMQSGTPTATIDPNWECNDCPEPQIMGKLSGDQASEQAGYHVLEPAYIPQGYELSTRDVLNTGATITTSTDYRMELEEPLHDGMQSAGIIAIGQTSFLAEAQPWESSVGDVPIVEVTVRRNPGAWLEQVPVYPFQDAEGNWQYAYWNQLVWSEDGFNFMIQTNMPVDLLPMEEIMKIAESMK
ncbi:MAG TPA: hypothetical protein PK040_06680 [Anaerolineaceae bacterium]|nr:hypothetical protein [Anaerolineaceae bacterium]